MAQHIITTTDEQETALTAVRLRDNEGRAEPIADNTAYLAFALQPAFASFVGQSNDPVFLRDREIARLTADKAALEAELAAR